MVRAYPIPIALSLGGERGAQPLGASNSLTVQMYSVSPSSPTGLLSASHLSSSSQHGDFPTASETPGAGET